MQKLSTPSTSHPRRWKKRPHIDGWDCAVWIAFTLIVAGILLFACIMLTLAWPSPAAAKAKTWHQVTTMSGGEETYKDQYVTRAFRLHGGRLKLTAQLTADPFCVEEDLLDWCLFRWTTEQISKTQSNYFWAAWTMDAPTADRWWTFSLPKGKYFAYPSTANLTWTWTLWEKR